ncbi:hypothetical protein GJ496_008671 [Pomphorhynchus laevis]|nr:hypothetical protein GJ496_008671 [Pomphorhynchus laevis]
MYSYSTGSAILLYYYIGMGGMGCCIFKLYSKDKEEWANYYEQLEHHFRAQSVSDDDHKKQLLLSWIGSEAYQLINRLNAGQSLDDTGYIQLVQLLNQHFLKPTHIIAARYSFHQYQMGPNDTYATWLVNLKDKARLCRFFNQTITNECQAIEERIRDHIVMKTPHDHVRNTMLQMENPTLDDLMRVCKTHELIQGTQQLVQCRSTEFGQSMTVKRETDQIDLIRSTNKCGRQHTRFQRCPATGKTCRRCGKIGHFEACCRSTNTPTDNNVRAVEMVSDNDSEILRSINTIGHDDIIPIINVSIISRAVWQHIGESTLHPASVENLRWTTTYENNEELYNLLQNYAEVFGPGTTHVKDYEVELTIDTNAIPHCWGSRRVPFSLRGSVEAELQRQLKQGVIEPVDTSQELIDWAAPIVVTHKSDGSGISKVVAYLEDIIMTGKTSNEHLDNLKKVLERLKQAGVKVKREKCSFLQERVKFLGHVLTKDCIQACPNKLEAIQKMPTPTNKGELRSFLGAVNHLNRGRRAVWSWKPEHTQAFEKVKESLMDARILKNFDIHKDVHLTCDASDNAYASRTLKPNENDYAHVEQERLAIVFAGSTGKAPAELLYGRRLKTIWDRLRPTTQTTVQSHREKQKERHDVNARPRQFDVHQAVWVRNQLTRQWQPGSIIDRTGWGSYVVNTQNGERRRHADDLRTNKEVNTKR